MNKMANKKTITHLFNIGDKVYFLTSVGVNFGKVLSVEISITDNVANVRYNISVKNAIMPVHKIIDECNLFESEELVMKYYFSKYFTNTKTIKLNDISSVTFIEDAIKNKNAIKININGTNKYIVGLLKDELEWF